MFAGAAVCSSQQLKFRRRSLEDSELLVRALVGAQERLGGRKRGPQERSLSLRGDKRERGPPERSLETRERGGPLERSLEIRE